MDTGRAFKSLLDNLDIDWEEQLSRVVGDVAAHQVGNVVRSAMAWGKQALDTLGRDAAEYFQEESEDLVRPAEVSEFLDQVDVLRDDAERLAARVNRLEQRLVAHAKSQQEPS
jgi:ubiquinone biosynthesis protein UbiJ